MEKKTVLAHKTNYGMMRKVSEIKYIVIHYTANDGDKAYNNARYFQTPGLTTSAHYFVDDTTIYQSVLDNYVAYSVGAKTADTSKGGGKYWKQATNQNTLNIELCDTNKNGSIYPTQKTIDNAIALTKELMDKYQIPVERVIRHFDVTGKRCPAYWTDNSKWDAEFKNKLAQSEGWVQDNKGWWYRYKNGSYPKSCWKKINGKDYYFKTDGYMAADEYIKAQDYATTKKLYYVNKDGSWNGKAYRWMQDEKGWWLAEIGDKWYAKDEWALIANEWYYFNDKGYMVTGTKTIGGKIYSFDKSGRMVGMKI